MGDRDISFWFALGKTGYTSQEEQETGGKGKVTLGTPNTRLLFPCNLFLVLSATHSLTFLVETKKKWLCPLCPSSRCLKCSEVTKFIAMTT